MQTTETDARQTALVVDFDTWERWFTTEILSDHGYTAVCASNGASGLRLLQQRPCDVILLDLALPELGGAEFIRQLKAADCTRDIPVILLGASPDEPSQAAEGWVPRPLDEAQLASEVGRVLTLRD